MFTPSLRRRVSLVTASAAASVLALAGLGGYAHAAPTPAVAPAAAPILGGTYELKPGYLPSGYEYMNVEDLNAALITGGTQTLHTTRYGTMRGASGRAEVIFFTVARGGNLTPDPSQPSITRTIGEFTGLYADTGRTRLFSFQPGLGSTDPVTIGSIGPVSESELDRVIAETVFSLVEPQAIPMSDPTGGSGGCSTTCPASTNMKGTGLYTNDWSSDGANRTLSNGKTGNDVALLQAMYYADCTDYGTGECYSKCWVDGIYGNTTEKYTYNFQSNEIVPDKNGDWSYADGIVGTTTWSYLDNYIVVINGSLVWDGVKANLALRRNSSSPYDYTWAWAGSGYRYTGYSGIHVNRPTGC